VLLLLSEQAVHDDNDYEISQDDIAHSPSYEQPEQNAIAQKFKRSLNLGCISNDRSSRYQLTRQGATKLLNW
jgi:predicted transcriptional regulator